MVSARPSRIASNEQAIELRLETIDRLFDPYDPFPTPTRDLAKSAEDFIVGWARELPSRSPLRIIIHLPASEAQSVAAADLANALERHFSYRAERTSGDLNELFRVGRISLAIGLGMLCACLLASRLALATWGVNDATRLLSEGLVIFGWVANWRPIEIFLYDWWPLAQRRRLYRRLAAAEVELRPAG